MDLPERASRVGRRDTQMDPRGSGNLSRAPAGIVSDSLQSRQECGGTTFQLGCRAASVLPRPIPWPQRWYANCLKEEDLPPLNLLFGDHAFAVPSTGPNSTSDEAVNA